jgi:D-alanyl-D-alanine carboxypeptidase
MKKSILLLAVLAVVGVGWYVWNKNDNTRQQKPDKTNGQSFDIKQHSLDDPKSIWIIVDKRRPLRPKNYAPDDLVAPDVPLRLTAKDEEMQMRQVAASAVKELFAAAEKDGINLMVSSAFRSYSYQEGLYDHYVSQQGKAVADTQSARPGHSEHQTGLAIDVEPTSRQCEVEECFGTLAEGKWVAKNAYKYGFVVRYPEGKQNITGYIYEPWHIRYVGKTLAVHLHEAGDPTLEEFFQIGAAPDYQ